MSTDANYVQPAAKPLNTGRVQTFTFNDKAVDDLTSFNYHDNVAMLSDVIL